MAPLQIRAAQYTDTHPETVAKHWQESFLQVEMTRQYHNLATVSWTLSVDWAADQTTSAIPIHTSAVARPSLALDTDSISGFTIALSTQWISALLPFRLAVPVGEVAACGQSHPWAFRCSSTSSADVT